jgi:hypothetical protein
VLFWQVFAAIIHGSHECADYWLGGGSENNLQVRNPAKFLPKASLWATRFKVKDKGPAVTFNCLNV